jgi:hypothetical protein
MMACEGVAESSTASMCKERTCSPAHIKVGLTTQNRAAQPWPHTHHDKWRHRRGIRSRPFASAPCQTHHLRALSILRQSPRSGRLRVFFQAAAKTARTATIPPRAPNPVDSTQFILRYS